MPLRPISSDLAGRLLAPQIGGALPLLDDAAEWFASANHDVLGAVVNDQAGDGRWLCALLRRNRFGEYEKLAVSSGYLTAESARSALDAHGRSLLAV